MKAAALFVLTLLAATPALAEERIYSYDPADEETRKRVGSGLTFVFDKGLFGMRIHEILATEARAKVLVQPAAENALGARLDRVIPPGTGAGEVYEILDREQGGGMIRAFCPGSSKAWLVFTPIKARRGLVMHAVGDNPGGGPARHCATMRFTYRGEWKAPAPIGPAHGLRRE